MKMLPFESPVSKSPSKFTSYLFREAEIIMASNYEFFLKYRYQQRQGKSHTSIGQLLKNKR